MIGLLEMMKKMREHFRNDGWVVLFNEDHRIRILLRVNFNKEYYSYEFSITEQDLINGASYQLFNNFFQDGIDSLKRISGYK
jgi:hypothetical protein